MQAELDLDEQDLDEHDLNANQMDIDDEEEKDVSSSSVKPKKSAKKEKAKKKSDKSKKEDAFMGLDTSKLEVYSYANTYYDDLRKDTDFHKTVAEIRHYFQNMREIIMEADRQMEDIDFFQQQITEIFQCYGRWKKTSYGLKTFGDWNEATTDDLNRLYNKLKNEMNYKIGFIIIE